MTHRRLLWIILAVALVLRLGYAAFQPPLAFLDGGSDSGWYWDFGQRQVTDQRLVPLSTAPLYLIFLGVARVLAPNAVVAVSVVRLVQILMSVATVYLAYRLTRTLADDDRAGLIAAVGLALYPTLIIESSLILTETMYIFFVVAGLALYVDLLAGRFTGHEAVFYAVVGGFFGLATLTRAAGLLFPAALALHASWANWPSRRALVRGMTLLLTYGAVVGIWTVYNLARWDVFVIGSRGLTSFVYLGASEEGWQSPEAVDAALNVQVEVVDGERVTTRDYSAIRQRILGDFGGYALTRFHDLGAAYLQPHGTVAFPGESLRALALAWLAEDRSPGGLIDVTRGDAFWPKLSIYVFHYAALIFGLAGMWLSRHRWRLATAPMGFIAYTTLLHLVLLALPRYIFPTIPLWWCFAAIALHRLITIRRHEPTPGLQPAPTQ